MRTAIVRRIFGRRTATIDPSTGSWIYRDRKSRSEENEISRFARLASKFISARSNLNLRVDIGYLGHSVVNYGGWNWENFIWWRNYRDMEYFCVFYIIEHALFFRSIPFFQFRSRVFYLYLLFLEIFGIIECSEESCIRFTIFRILLE